MSPGITGVALGLVAFVAAPLIATTARAQINNPSSAQSHQILIQKLKNAREIAAANQSTDTQDPIAAREFGEQKAELTGLIERLKSGAKVSPDEITQALRSPDPAY